MQEALFVVVSKVSKNAIIYRMVGFNEVYFIDEDKEMAILFTECGQLKKQWNNIYEFRDDFSRDCFDSDEEMMRAEFQLKVNKRTLNHHKVMNIASEDYASIGKKEFAEWSELLAARAQHPVFYN